MNGRRWFAVGMTIAAIAVGGWKGAIPGLDLASSSSSAGAAGQLEVASAFPQAAGALDVYRATAGTYAGAELSPTSPVRLAWADDSQYCLEGGAGVSELHLVGPGGAPQPGMCPPAG